MKWGFYFMVGFMELVGVFWAIEFRAGFEFLPVCKVCPGNALYCQHNTECLHSNDTYIQLFSINLRIYSGIAQC
ncbi:MAG: hypothetical protein M9911_11170 [Saprospiraceae bacterium]|nr:hypothetical protein [Saprospiraceae bacterium]MCO5278541.1 hypothetical protein [Saprospiraceae bacterium]